MMQDSKKVSHITFYNNQHSTGVECGKRNSQDTPWV